MIRAWTEYGYDSVPYFELYSDDPEVIGYGRMDFSGHLPDGMMVFVGGYFRTNWGWYVHVEKFTNELIEGWVHVDDLQSFAVYAYNQYLERM